MQKNDYRRSVIMLRPIRSGYSGHARLERRTLMGDLYLNAAVPGNAGPLHMTLAGSKQGKWYAWDAGTLHTDSRGQAAGRFHFDPRNIGSRELEDYSVVLVTKPAQTNTDILLAGSMKGAAIDWAALREAVRDVYSPSAETVLTLHENAATDSTLPDMPEATAQCTWPNATVQEDTPGPAPSATETQPPADSRSVPVTPVPLPEEGPAIPNAPGAGNIPVTPLPLPEEGPAIPNMPDTGNIPVTPLPLPEEGPAIPNAPGAGNIPVTPLPLPEEGPVIPDFPTAPVPEPCCNAAPPLPQIEGYIFVHLPSPAGCGFACAAIGLRTESGCITGVCYALPGRWQPEPPVGLEDYTWLGRGAQGWWIDCLDICTLAPSPSTCIQPREDQR